MLKILRHVHTRPCTVQMVRGFSVSTLPQKKLDLTPESEIILLTGQEKSQTTIKYSELLEKAGKKNLVRVTKSKMKRDLPMFQLMSDVELEIAIRKEKSHSASYAGVRTSYGNTLRLCSSLCSITITEMDGGKLKLKELDLKSRITENDFTVQTAKILKWLEKGNFVAVSIKVARESSKEEAENLKKRIEALLVENKDLIPNASRLTFKM